MEKMKKKMQFGIACFRAECNRGREEEKMRKEAEAVRYDKR